MLLKAVGPNLGVTEPAEMFWATGALSSFLDNTPTYLVFLTTAGTLAFTNGITTTLGTVPVPRFCLQFPVVLYSWVPTLISEMPRTLW